MAQAWRSTYAFLKQHWWATLWPFLPVVVGIGVLWQVRGQDEALSEVVQLVPQVLFLFAIVPAALFVWHLLRVPALLAHDAEQVQKRLETELLHRETTATAQREAAASRLDALRHDGQGIRNALQAYGDAWPPSAYMKLVETWERAVTICLAHGLPDYLARYRAVGEPAKSEEETEPARQAWWAGYLDMRARVLLDIHAALMEEAETRARSRRPRLPILERLSKPL